MALGIAEETIQLLSSTSHPNGRTPFAASENRCRPGCKLVSSSNCLLSSTRVAYLRSDFFETGVNTNTGEHLRM